MNPAIIHHFPKFLRYFDNQDLKGLKAWIENEPTLLKRNDYSAHPWIRMLEQKSKVQWHKASHAEIGNLLIPEACRNFQDAILQKSLKEIKHYLIDDPKLVQAEFLTHRGRTQAIHIWNKLSLAELLLKSGANIESKTSRGETPLAMQIRFGTIEGIQYLLEKGADPKAVQNAHMPTKQMPGIIELMLKHGWDINKGQLLHDANHGHGSRVRVWLKYGANPNVALPDGRTALHLIASKGISAETITALIKAGADPTQLDSNGKTPMELAQSAPRSFAWQSFLKLELAKGSHLSSSAI